MSARSVRHSLVSTTTTVALLTTLVASCTLDSSHCARSWLSCSKQQRHAGLHVRLTVKLNAWSVGARHAVGAAVTVGARLSGAEGVAVAVNGVIAIVMTDMAAAAAEDIATDDHDHGRIRDRTIRALISRHQNIQGDLDHAHGLGGGGHGRAQGTKAPVDVITGRVVSRNHPHAGPHRPAHQRK